MYELEGMGRFLFDERSSGFAGLRAGFSSRAGRKHHCSFFFVSWALVVATWLAYLHDHLMRLWEYEI